MNRAKPSVPRSGSIPDIISHLMVGQRTYIERPTLMWCAVVQRQAKNHNRWPDSMAGMQFITTLFTAVSAVKAGDIRYLVCIERTK